jgi:hypothetical protein
MPDLFSGCMLLGAAILIGLFPGLGRFEKLFWAAAVIFALLVHKGNIPVLVVLCVIGCIWQLCMARRGREDRTVPDPLVARNILHWRAFGLLAVMIFGACVSHALYEASVRSRGRQIQNFPFLMARVIGDGTAPLFLDEICGSRPYFVCRYRSRLPMSADEFLWAKEPGRGGFATASSADRMLIEREQWAIVSGAVLGHPFRQFAATASNAAGNILRLGIGAYAYPIEFTKEQQGGLAPFGQAYRNSAISQHSFPVRAVSRWMKLLLAGCVILLFALTLREPRLLFGSNPRARARLLLLIGFFANGAVTGALSGISDRYQGRVLWIVPFIVATILWEMSNARSEAPGSLRTIG